MRVHVDKLLYQTSKHPINFGLTITSTRYSNNAKFLCLRPLLLIEEFLGTNQRQEYKESMGMLNEESVEPFQRSLLAMVCLRWYSMLCTQGRVVGVSGVIRKKQRVKRREMEKMK